MNSNPVFHTIYGQKFFRNTHSMYLHSEIISIYSVFIGSDRDPQFPRWIQVTSTRNFVIRNFISLISDSLFTLPQLYQSFIKLHFLPLLLHIKSIKLLKDRMAFIVKEHTGNAIYFSPRLALTAVNHQKFSYKTTVFFLYFMAVHQFSILQGAMD